MTPPSPHAFKPLAATARLQFHKDFTLDDAVRLVPYYDKLGITHLYASPLLTARAGSTHGYDIVDHNRINPELGGEDALHRLVAELRLHRMGLILDIVPNHMGVGGNDNAWWSDVLEWGRASPYAEYFDIDWEPPDVALRGRMLAPFLGKSYGGALNDGDLRLEFDGTDGRLFVSYFGTRFPIAPRDYASVLLTESGPLEAPARMFNELAGGRDAQRAAAEAARAELALPVYHAAIEEALRAYDPKSPEGRERLHRLLERQNYRLAWWRAATDEINWRRFFDVNGLAGLRIEVPEVFEATHATVFRLYRDGLIDGVRIDHVDGLANPRDYCRKLRRRMDTEAEHRPADLPRDTPPIWIEKILAPFESVSSDWLTDGTTGYDFMNDASAVLHDPAGEAPLTQFWTETTGRPAEFAAEAEPARRQILRDSLSSELYGTAIAVHRIARRDLTTRDYTLTAIRRALEEILAHFKVYRIYANVAGISEIDRRQLDWAMAGARRTIRFADLPLLDLVGRWLAGEGLRAVPAGTRRQEWLRAMVRFQQLSAPVAAKSVEDTAFYRFGRLLSRNEVGSEPSQWAITPAALHNGARVRRRSLPRALLATATHDHKRGEDNRVRLAVLSELPDEWKAATARWIRLNAPLKKDVHGPAPDAADELMMYQSIVGAWPLDLRADDADGLNALEERVAAWLEKALREAKRHTGWSAPESAYEQAARGFLAQVLDPGRASGLVADIAGFVARIAPAGVVNSLTQVVLRLTQPGIPDLYQGTEFWDWSLVDPDNRRSVDFNVRQAALENAQGPAALMKDWRDGRVKQAVIARALALRARAPGLFTEGSYTPLRIDGPLADNALAYARVHEGRGAVVVVSRLSARHLSGDLPLIPAEAWKNTAVLVPRSLAGRNSANILDDSGGDRPLPSGGRLPLSTVLATCPVAVLELK